MRASVVEVNKLEHRVSFLATTASITPFIGLFGTVVGILMAFEGIAQTGSTNLSVVARPIADASWHGDGSGGGHSAVFTTTCHAAREAVRVGDGRFRDGVPEHRRAEFHLTCRRSTGTTPSQGRHGRGRRVATSLSEITGPDGRRHAGATIIFMAAAPMIQRGVDVNLPVARTRSR
jgi:hypothetical protein